MSAETQSAGHSTTTFAMPSLGADMTEGRITEWLVHPGDRVERGQIVVIVETDKSDIEVEVFEPATVVELLAAEGDVVPVGTPIARFETAVRTGSKPEQAAEPSVGVPVSGSQQAAPATSSAQAESERVPVAAGSTRVTSPVIRHLADELHVDLERARGTGPGGRVHRDDVRAAARLGGTDRVTPRGRRIMLDLGIDPSTSTTIGSGIVTGDDVLAFAARPTPSPPNEPPTDERPSREAKMRRHIAELMTRSWHEIPHYHVTKRLDLSVAVDRLAAVNVHRSVTDRVLPGALLLSAAARAAAKVPACNGWWRDDQFMAAGAVDLGVVVSLRSGGVIVPTIQRADELGPVEMMGRLTELVQRARQGRLRASDMAAASITVTNLGDLGADTVLGVIHPPQVAIIGFGSVHDEVWALDGSAVVHPTVHASLAGDHRSMEGLIGSRFLAHVQIQLDGALLEEF